MRKHETPPRTPMNRRHLTRLLVATAFASAVAAQPGPESRTIAARALQCRVVHDQPLAREARFLAVAFYGERTGPLADHTQHLQDLQVRFAERGAAVTVVLPAADAEAWEAASARVVVATTTRDLGAYIGQVLVVDRDGKVLCKLRGPDGLSDVLERLLEERFDPADFARHTETLRRLPSMVTEGGAYGRQIRELLEATPSSGRARALAVLNRWWCEGDLTSARGEVCAGLAALARAPASLTLFADLVLRGDRYDEVVARDVAIAMTTVAAGAPDGAFTQLVHLRALLRAGMDKHAQALAAKLPELIGDDARLHLVLSETLMEGATPRAFEAAAAGALRRAEALEGDRKWIFATRHKLLVRCGHLEEADRWIQTYRDLSDAHRDLNNDAWYTMTGEDTMGRFDTLAAAQCQEMLRVQGDAVDANELDTAALGMFVGGDPARAAQLQRRTIASRGPRPHWLARLRRYEETLRAVRAQRPR